jgi:hypothetical protein
MLFADEQGRLAYPDGEPFPFSLRGIDLADAQQAFQVGKARHQRNGNAPSY